MQSCKFRRITLEANHNIQNYWSPMGSLSTDYMSSKWVHQWNWLLNHVFTDEFRISDHLVNVKQISICDIAIASPRYDRAQVWILCIWNSPVIFLLYFGKATNQTCNSWSIRRERLLLSDTAKMLVYTYLKNDWTCKYVLYTRICPGNHIGLNFPT